MARRLAESATETIVADIAAARGLDPATVREIVDRAPLTAPEALEARLVDRLGYRDEVYASLRSRLGDVRLLYLERYGRRRERRGTLRRAVTGRESPGGGARPSVRPDPPRSCRIVSVGWAERRLGHARCDAACRRTRSVRQGRRSTGGQPRRVLRRERRDPPGGARAPGLRAPGDRLHGDGRRLGRLLHRDAVRRRRGGRRRRSRGRSECSPASRSSRMRSAGPGSGSTASRSARTPRCSPRNGPSPTRSGSGSRRGWIRSTRTSPTRRRPIAGCRWNSSATSRAAGSGPGRTLSRTGWSTGSAGLEDAVGIACERAGLAPRRRQRPRAAPRGRRAASTAAGIQRAAGRCARRAGRAIAAGRRSCLARPATRRGRSHAACRLGALVTHACLRTVDPW